MEVRESDFKRVSAIAKARKVDVASTNVKRILGVSRVAFAFFLSELNKLSKAGDDVPGGNAMEYWHLLSALSIAPNNELFSADADKLIHMGVMDVKESAKDRGFILIDSRRGHRKKLILSTLGMQLVESTVTHWISAMVRLGWFNQTSQPKKDQIVKIAPEAFAFFLEDVWRMTSKMPCEPIKAGSAIQYWYLLAGVASGADDKGRLCYEDTILLIPKGLLNIESKKTELSASGAAHPPSPETEDGEPKTGRRFIWEARRRNMLETVEAFDGNWVQLTDLGKSLITRQLIYFVLLLQRAGCQVKNSLTA